VSDPGRPTPKRVVTGRIRPRRIPGVHDIVGFFRHLGRPSRISTLRAVGDGGYVAWTLKRRGIRPLLGPTPSHATPDAAGAGLISEAVDAGLGVLPAAPTCLRRSVTLIRELNRLGLASTLHIGVRSVDGGVIGAHAWVQVEDVVVNDDPEQTGTYTELAVGELDRLLPLLR